MEMKSTALPVPPSPFTPVLFALGGWFFVALAVGRLELLRGAGPAAVAAMMTGLVLLQIVVFRRWEPFRQGVLLADLRLPVLLHLVRFTGISFLALHAQDRLPAAFAMPAGWGDIAVAALAPVAAVMAGSGSRSGRWIAGAWNLLGLAHLLVVAVMGTSLGLHDPRIGQVVTSLPHALLPAFVVPLVAGSHLLIALRLYHEGGGKRGRL